MGLYWAVRAKRWKASEKCRDHLCLKINRAILEFGNITYNYLNGCCSYSTDTQFMVKENSQMTPLS